MLVLTTNFLTEFILFIVLIALTLKLVSAIAPAASLNGAPKTIPVKKPVRVAVPITAIAEEYENSLSPDFDDAPNSVEIEVAAPHPSLV